MRDYELVCIVSPQVQEENLAATTERITGFITGRGGTVAKSDTWGRRRLAYPIDGFREGTYLLLQFNLDPEAADEFERSLRLAEDVIRHLLVRLS